MAAESLADRMKRYEAVTTSATLIRRLPVIIRVDGRAFHTWTRRLQKPFDGRLSVAMSHAAQLTLQEIQGAKIAYVQSDEASFLLLDTARLETQPWLGYDLQKVVSLAAAEFSGWFNRGWHNEGGPLRPYPATFDARAFNLPPEEVANYFLWRVKDAHRNAVLGAGQSVLSPRQMHGKKLGELLELPEVRAAYDVLTRFEQLGTWHLPGGVAPPGVETTEATYEAVAWFLRSAVGGTW